MANKDRVALADLIAMVDPTTIATDQLQNYLADLQKLIQYTHSVFPPTALVSQHVFSY